MKRKHRIVLAIAALLIAVSASWAAVTSGTSDIGQQIASKDPAQIAQAVAAIREQLHSVSSDERSKAVNGLARKSHWLAKLEDVHQYEEVVRLTQEATVAVPWDLRLVEYVQWHRAQALLALKQPQAALAVAKGLFNVARMQNVAEDLSLIAKCLQAAHPGDASCLDKLKSEQISGSETTFEQVTLNRSKGPLFAIGPRSSVMDGIKIDGSIYRTAIRQYAGNDYTNLVARGNVLLLADRPKEAKALFVRAYALADDKHLAAATENVARCMKAEDGTIGRANAWVMSIRPK